MENILGKNGTPDVGSLGTKTSVESYYYYYYAAAAAAAAVIVLVISAIDITPVAPADNFDREMAIRTLIEKVN
ncbi:hypothetical protein [Melghirimyces algeriensis]|uniref:Uncharacterized protein n=1 Tax=Melghirimyces algeriensis TaxID=910412 RepID=A0A521DEY2_9BACL|nr:hypothetical protein [Melghirimyces algeriensis]SMO70155.1 hypothetical protein SAMN06264849_10616 [Melghirimyces algeriensis]